MTRKNNSDFIKKLKLAMLESGLNQTKLAKKLGLASNSVSRWILGQSNPKFSTLEDIAKATNKPLNYFFDNSSTNIGGDNIKADRFSEVKKENNIQKDLKILQAQMEVMKKEIENINLKIDLLKKKK